MVLSQVTGNPWEMGKQQVWNVTVVVALAPNRLNQGSLFNLGTTAIEAEARKIEKYRELIDNGYIFQPVALEDQGSLVESGEIFITRLCKMLCRSHDDQRADSFLKQRISMALQIGNAACVPGTVSDRCVLLLRRNVLHLTYFLEPISLRYRSRRLHYVF